MKSLECLDNLFASLTTFSPFSQISLQYFGKLRICEIVLKLLQLQLRSMVGWIFLLSRFFILILREGKLPTIWIWLKFLSTQRWFKIYNCKIYYFTNKIWRWRGSLSEKVQKRHYYVSSCSLSSIFIMKNYKLVQIGWWNNSNIQKFGIRRRRGDCIQKNESYFSFIYLFKTENIFIWSLWYV